MDISYDPRYNIAYIRFRKKATGVETRHISDEINIDVSLMGEFMELNSWTPKSN